jgi:hypothetical protein
VILLQHIDLIPLSCWDSRRDEKIGTSNTINGPQIVMGGKPFWCWMLLLTRLLTEESIRVFATYYKELSQYDVQMHNRHTVPSLDRYCECHTSSYDTTVHSHTHIGALYRQWGRYRLSLTDWWQDDAVLNRNLCVLADRQKRVCVSSHTFKPLVLKLIADNLELGWDDKAGDNTSCLIVGLSGCSIVMVLLHGGWVFWAADGRDYRDQAVVL